MGSFEVSFAFYSRAFVCETTIYFFFVWVLVKHDTNSVVQIAMENCSAGSAADVMKVQPSNKCIFLLR